MTWLVWEEEYPEEGSWEVRAKSAGAAKAKYRRETGEDTALLRAALLTPKLRVARAANERRERLARTRHGAGVLR